MAHAQEFLLVLVTEMDEYGITTTMIIDLRTGHTRTVTVTPETAHGGITATSSFSDADSSGTACACVTCILMYFIVLGLLGLGIAKIVIGAKYMDDCDIQYRIPIFLIVSAILPILFCDCCRQGEGGQECTRVCSFIGALFNVGWLIAGSVWVYGTWSTVKSDSYVPCDLTNPVPGCTNGTCNDVLLKFAFATCTIDCVLITIGIVYYIWQISRYLCKSNDPEKQHNLDA